MSEKTPKNNSLSDTVTLQSQIGTICIPREVYSFVKWLTNSGYAVWFVGGIIRDGLLGKNPKDWDIATTAPSEVVIKSPFKAIPVGIRFGVIHVVVGNDVVEVVSIPESTKVGTIDADLERRDFTINAMALSFPEGKLIDRYGGRRDLKAGRIKAVRDPDARFREDPVRILRAARFVSTYGFKIAAETRKAMKRNAEALKTSPIERIRDEMFRLLPGDNVVAAVDILRSAGALSQFFPEILEGWRKKQNEFHKFDIYRHILLSVSFAPPRLRVRLAALFHDIAKPRVRVKRGNRYRFFGHDKESEKLAREILERWRVNHDLIEQVCRLVKNHMVYDIQKWSDAAIRRLIARVGEDLIEDFIELVRADRLAHGFGTDSLVEVENLRKRVHEQLNQRPPLKTTDLAVNGHDVMRILAIPQGPEVGRILRFLHAHVVDHPQDNNREKLIELMLKLRPAPAANR
ncbi:MAG: CCA tRNA nucleotidyltransferase [Deltaproteobacteria bacterium]|nr:CCA tRNA nucleotidyltransferase [Deltaproteobacteria bacterium]MBW2069011.1 CCA tRNA nucleotidyltransferase [Deltaproteobacteria bacterium]